MRNDKLRERLTAFVGESYGAAIMEMVERFCGEDRVVFAVDLHDEACNEPDPERFGEISLSLRIGGKRVEVRAMSKAVADAMARDFVKPG